MAKITSGDFDYLKRKLYKDKTEHEKQFIERINPDKIDDYFEGIAGGNEDGFKPNSITLNRVFPATTTLISQFYPSNPKFVLKSNRPDDELNSRIAVSGMNYYYTQMNALIENQKAIMSAWLYGFGVTKQGWRTKFIKPEKPDVVESKGLGEKIKSFFNSPKIEEDVTPDYIANEAPFLNFRNSKNIYFDSDQPFGKGLHFHEYIPTTLREIRESGLYRVDEDFYSMFSRYGKDEREIKIELYENYCWIGDSLYLLVFVDGFKKPLRYDKLPYAGEGFPYKVLTLTTQINKLYPISHMKVALRLQRFQDYILTLQKDYIEKGKNIDIFDGSAFHPDDREKIIRNEIGLNVFTKDGFPATTAATHLGGNTIPKDYFAVGDIVSSNIKEILTVVGARQTGESEMETATQEKIAEFGNQLRAQGMLDAIRLFLIAQGKKLLQDMKQFATAPALFEITGLNLQDEKGNLVTSKWVEFATDRSPEKLKDIIPKDLDIDVDITSTVRRDIGTIRTQLFKALDLLRQPDITQLLAIGNERVKIGKLIIKLLENFETIDNPSQYIEDIPTPVQAPQPMNAPMGQPMQPPTAPQVPMGAI